ncbi:phage holin [Aminipila terrae]|uniref:Phage holin n=1 Tax=Aminipila terrae TaxID=2697030 RepID=A0A6P1MHI0_9FIRM|nr:phage holin [Aminipila terrae]QHI71468.1 phage holin [Aminipila terrae]
MKINWKLRIKNKTTFAALMACIVTLVYQILGILGITIPVSQDEIIQAISVILNLLVTLGVLVDPTTEGTSDSPRALTYNRPN